MEKIEIQGTPKSPSVTFDADTGLIELEGRSIPENSLQFYRPLIEWLDRYKDKTSSATTVNLKLEYFNTSSSKCIMDILKRIQEIHKAGKEVIVNWHYEFDDDDMKETGEDYKEMTGLPFKMVEVQELF